MKFFCNLLILSFLFIFPLYAQEVVYLKNPSFEGVPKYGTLPGAWRNCAFNNESPPDLHPVKRGSFGVTQTPMDGNSYIGLVARDNSTTESIGQQLLTPLKSGQCYQVTLALCRSEKLTSRSRKTGKTVNLNSPLTLRVWGGISPCGKKTLLAISKAIDNTNWEKYTFQFKPEENLTWISFEANYAEKQNGAYNGNLLIDDASAIVPISCETQTPLVAETSIQQPEYSYVNPAKLKNVRTRPFYSIHKGSDYYMDYRVVDSPTEINALIVDNCPNMGFQFGSYLFTDEFGLALKEIAVNVIKHKSTLLLLGIPNAGKELVAKRKKTLKRIFREISLSKGQYEIVVLPPNWEEDGWMCGGQELWMRLEDRGFSN